MPDERRLIPRSGAIRRDVLRICALATGLADKAVSLLCERVLRPEEGRTSIWVDRRTTQIGETLDRLDAERAAARPEYWFGAITHADIALGCALRLLDEAHSGILRGRARPALLALLAHSVRCEATALFQSAVQPLQVRRLRAGLQGPGPRRPASPRDRRRPRGEDGRRLAIPARGTRTEPRRLDR